MVPQMTRKWPKSNTGLETESERYAKFNVNIGSGAGVFQRN